MEEKGEEQESYFRMVLPDDYPISHEVYVCVCRMASSPR